MKNARGNNWDIDWNTIGHVKPKVKSVAEPQKTTSPGLIESRVATVTSPQRPTVPAASVKPRASVVAMLQRQVAPVQPVNLKPSQPRKPEQPIVSTPSVKPRPADNLDNGKQFEEKKMQTSTITKPQSSGTIAVVARSAPRKNERDLLSGIELLGLDFLLNIVESTEGDDKNDVTMRKLNFNELARTEQLHTADSHALKVYAMNEGGLYGKDIQSQAMSELARRTAQHSQDNG